VNDVIDNNKTNWEETVLAPFAQKESPPKKKFLLKRMFESGALSPSVCPSMTALLVGLALLIYSVRGG
jgi:hypothetical protein